MNGLTLVFIATTMIFSYKYFAIKGASKREANEHNESTASTNGLISRLAEENNQLVSNNIRLKRNENAMRESVKKAEKDRDDLQKVLAHRVVLDIA